MQATVLTSLFRFVSFMVTTLLLAGCFGEGDGPTRIPGTPAPPPPPDGFCDGFNFEVECEPFTITNFAGGSTVIIDNPDKSGLNTTDRVARMQKFDPGNGETFGGSFLELDDSIDFSEGTAFTMKVWASRSVPVLFKLETASPFVFQERTRDHSGSGAWEELCFDFTGSTAGLVPTGLALIFDIGVTGKAATDPANWTFFYDEITQVANCDGVVVPAPVNLPVTFEAPPESYDFGPENGFAGGVATVIANPDRSGLNTTAQTARMQKFAGEVFGGATLVLDDLIDFGAGEAFNMKVWSARPVPVLFKLEDAVSGDPELGKESTLDHSGSGSWEQLCFDFSGNVDGFSSNSITFIFDNGVLGDAENNADDWTFYFDEITQVASCGGGGADPGIIPDVVVYASDPSVTVDLPPPMVDVLGADATFDLSFTGDADFNPALRVRSGGDTGGGIDGNIAVNGGFETGSFDGWQLFENNGVLAIVTDSPSSGLYAANLVVPVRGPDDSAADPLIKNANLQAGNLTPGASVTISFDMRGSLSGAGGVVFAEFFSELDPEGTSAAEILGGDPLVPTADWTTYSFTTTLGPDVSGGVTLQLKASCGPVEGCGVDAFFDNVSIVIGTGALSILSGTDVGGGFDATVASAHANVGQIALTGYAPGFAAGFETFDFKVKGLPTGTIEVRFIEGGDTSRVYDVTTDAGSTELGNGWYQLSIPLTDFAATIASNQGFVLGPLGEQAAPFSFLLTDIGFSGTAGGGGGDGVAIDFDGEGPFNFADFEGGVATVIANPDPSGLNVSAQVARMQKFAGATFAGSTLPLASAVDFSAGPAFTMKVWSARPVPVTFKLEGLGLERVANHSGGSVWQELCFDFSGSTVGAPATGITFIFDNGVAGDAENDPTNWTFYFDAIEQVSGCAAEPPPPVSDFPTITFDDLAVTYTLTSFGGNASVVTNDPAGGTNMVAQVIKPTDAEVWAGTTVSTLADGAVPEIPFTASETQMTVRVYSPDADIPVMLKVEDAADATLFVEALATTTVANEWETLTFDFATQRPESPPLNLANTYNRVSIFFNFGFTGAGEKTYFFDDIAFGGGTEPPPPPPVGDNIVVNGDFETGTFAGWDLFPGGGTQAIVTDNPSSGTFAANLAVPVRGPTDAAVDNFIKNANLEAGNLTPGAEVTVSFDMRGTLSGAGGVVFAELFSEQSGGGASKSEQLSGGPLAPTADWTTYTFPTTLGPDVSGGVTLQLKASCGPVEGCGVDVFFDNVSISLGGGTEPPPPPPPPVGDNIVVNGDFETGTFAGWDLFPGGGTQAIVTDNPSSGTYAANLIVPVRGPTDAGMDNLIKNSNLQAGNLTPGASVTVSFDMRGTLSGAGGVVFAEFFSELAGGGTSKSELLSGAPLAPTAGWTTYSFTTTLGPDVSGGVTLQLKASCGPVEGCGVDVFFDNVSIVVAGGGGEPPPPAGGVAIDFDGTGPFNFVDFGGGFATVVDNPDPSGINNSASVAQMQKFAADPWGGSTLPLASAVDFSAGPAFTVKVWSARLVPVTFKLEGLNQERVATHSGGSVWQELCFDFTGSTVGMPANGITFIFDNGVVGDAQNDPDNWTFYFDAISQVSNCTATPPPPVSSWPTITFDDPLVTYTLTPFGGNESVRTNDPDGGANMVVQVNKPVGAALWAGTTASTLPNDSVPAIGFTASETRMTVRVYSPDAGIPVLLKVEDAANNDLFVETLATTTVANEWETLTFDFANPGPDTRPLNLANTYNRVSIFFNFGVTGTEAGAKTYYFDDIGFAGGVRNGEPPPPPPDIAGNIVINGDFETGTFEGWETLPGGGIQTIVTDNPSSGTYAANLVVPERGPGDGPLDNLIKNSNLQAGNLVPGTAVTVSFDLRGTLSGDGGVVFAELFSELAGEGTSKSEILGGVPLVPTADWASCSFNTTLGPDVGGGVTLQLKTSCGPVEGCGVDAFFDNVSIVLGTEGDGGGCGGGGGGDVGGGGVWDGGGIAVNGGFETGTFEGWETLPGGGIQTIVTDNPSSGTYAANLVVPERGPGDGPLDNLIKNSNLQAGNLTPGAAVTVSFDLRGTLSGDGGVVFAELFSELAGEGTSKSEILGGVPLAPSLGWRKYSFDTTLGPDVGGGVTLQLKTSCGPVLGCGVDAFFDNVSIVIN